MYQVFSKYLLNKKQNKNQREKKHDCDAKVNAIQMFSQLPQNELNEPECSGTSISLMWLREGLG